MTRAWYGGILRALAASNRSESLYTVFVYVPAAFQPPSPEYPANEVVAPVRGFSGLTLPNLPTALVLGLGYDPGRAISITNELDPGIVLTFKASPASDHRYEAETERIHRDYLDSIPQEQQFSYPLTDVLTTFHLVEGVCTGLARDWRVVLASFGPKIFSLTCFILAAKHPELSVWRVSAGTKEASVDRKPGRSVIALEVQWTSRGDSPNVPLEAVWQ
jgi:hypothetical protein